MRGRRDELADLALFADTSRAELAVIRRHLTQMPMRAGRVLVEEGTRGDQFMIIAEGVVKVTRGGRTIAILERGDLVGEMALLDDVGPGRRNATVTVSTNGTVYAGTPVEFRRILEAAPTVALKVRQTAEDRRRAA